VRKSDISTGLFYNGRLTALGYIDSSLAYVKTVVPIQSFTWSRIKREKMNDQLLKGKRSGPFQDTVWGLHAQVSETRGKFSIKYFRILAKFRKVSKETFLIKHKMGTRIYVTKNSHLN
jgi:hypothetical protein